MGFELNEIGATLAAGMYFLIGLAALFFVARPGWSRAVLGRLHSSKLPVAIVGGIVSFAIGIFLERLSNLASDRLSILPKDEDIRSGVFHEKFADDYALEAAHISAVWGPRAPGMLLQLTQATEVSSLSPPTPSAPSAAGEIYFEAKSAAMRDGSYAADLMLTQTHIRFTRSFAVTSFALAALACVVAALRLLLALRSRWAIPGGAGVHARHCAAIVFAFALLWWTTRTAYELEEEHYDERAYGYYLHMIRGDRTG
jgi:hypothetical protein